MAEDAAEYLFPLMAEDAAELNADLFYAVHVNGFTNEI